MSYLTENFQVGDIISMPEPHPTVPRELQKKFFRVESVTDGAVKLSIPYDDAACTVPYRATPPRLVNGYPAGKDE